MSEFKVEKIKCYNNYLIKDDDDDKIILSIDIGILNMGLSITIVDEEFNIKEIKWVDLIDITQYTHNTIPEKECKLRHTKSIADWMEHIFYEHNQLFEKVNYILLERQPFQGLVVIEQIIYYRWREKCSLVSPNAMHKYFNIHIYEYEKRKEKTIAIADKLGVWSLEAIANYKKFERKHDMSDSICLMAFWLSNKRKEYVEIQRKKKYDNTRLSKNGVTVDEWFEQFKYNVCKKL